MINFPGRRGNSGHLVGGTLLGIVLGPWRRAGDDRDPGMQAFLFQDGGILALGTTFAIWRSSGVFAGYCVFLWGRSFESPQVGWHLGGLFDRAGQRALGFRILFGRAMLAPSCC